MMMRTPAWLASLAHLLLVLCVPTILIVSPLFIFFSTTFVRYEYNRSGFPPSVRFEQAERLRISDMVLRFIRGTATRDDLSTAQTDSGEIALREEEVQHLADVKRVVDALVVAQRLALVTSVTSFFLLWQSSRRLDAVISLQQGAWVIFGLMILILISSLIDFNTFFTRFHQVFFSEGSWLFYEDDTLIQMYPLVFWIDTVWKLVVVIVVETGVLWAASQFLASRVRSGEVGS